ncbi:TraM recognition domain-containing protein [Streptomyces sp. NPDC002564]|uniref:TraM recognition domain-containing protein n=1 Tax=Streptomyces sp. NPDC002564 TaxID=3364649 RepID=UPI0036765D9D
MRDEWERGRSDAGRPPHGRGGSDRGGRPERGVPDGLLVGFLAFLIGATVLVWSATNLAGRFAHGAWPENVSFGHTPPAVRHLVGSPQDVAGAWPRTPADQLSGYGLFWGLFIGQLLILTVLTVFVTGTVARWRAVRRRARAERWESGWDEYGREKRGPAGAGRRGAGENAVASGPAPGAGTPPTEHVPAPPNGRSRPGAPGMEHTAPVPAPGATGGTGVEHTAPAGRGTDHAASAGPGAEHPHPSGPDPEHTAPASRGAGHGFPAAPGAPAAPGTGHGFPADHGTPASPGTGPGFPAGHGTPTGPDTGHGIPAAPGTGPGPVIPLGAPPHSPLPAPRTPLVLGSPTTRRPLAVQAVQDAEAAALVLTSDPTLWAETKDARAKLGPVLLYDPSHLCDTPARLHWSPTSGCQDRTTADHRAAALLAPIRPTAKLDTAVSDTARILLRSFLHAAAVADKPMKLVHRWSQGTQVQEAVRILRTHPKASSGAAGELEAALTAYPERRDMAQELTARALSALFTVHVRESCTPNRTDALSLDSFVAEGGTLFVVGEAIEDPKSRQGPGAMPLLTALASSVVEHGRRMAERSSSGRLDPPMTLVLDDVAAVAPLPQLPDLLATGADRGMPTLALLRSREQGRARWPDSELPAQ